jgi:hypothetical protein
MHGVNRWFPVLLLASCAWATQAAEVDQAIERAARFLCAQQQTDGTWRSATYGTMRDGLSLTPHVASALYFAAADSPASGEAFQRAAKFLSAAAVGSGEISIYSAAAATWVTMFAGEKEAQANWVRNVKSLRLGRENGWSPADPEFGGWSYSLHVPRKPGPGEPHPEGSNLSATLFGLGALRAAGTPPDDPVFGEILSFASRCQNLPGDGGFFFSPTEPFRNKAGDARPGGYSSYGSATCDGVRALVRCGLARDHPRVIAARKWIERNFSASENPGYFAPDRHELRNSYYFYYCWSFVHAMQALGLRGIERDGEVLDCPALLKRELLRRQEPDGSWRNAFTDGKEDDPLVATPLALATLLLAK